MRVKLTVDYIGTNYAGWQFQPGQTTIQGELEAALDRMTGERNAIVGSGRTDAGVHALAQTAHFDTAKDWDAQAFVGGLNRSLPRDIRVLYAERTDETFHARYSAVKKTYIYRMYVSTVDRAVYLNRAARVGELNADSMRAAATYFLGVHDFASFRAANSDTKTSVRTVFETGVQRVGGEIVFTVTADGFLYNMVRIMTGVLIRVGSGEIKPEAVADILAARDRGLARDTAPACGLYLREVTYD